MWRGSEMQKFSNSQAHAEKWSHQSEATKCVIGANHKSQLQPMDGSQVCIGNFTFSLSLSWCPRHRANAPNKGVWGKALVTSTVTRVKTAWIPWQPHRSEIKPSLCKCDFIYDVCFKIGRPPVDGPEAWNISRFYDVQWFYLIFYHRHFLVFICLVFENSTAKFGKVCKFKWSHV